MGEFEVLQQAVEFAAVQRTPGTVKVISRLRLLPRIIVVQKLEEEQTTDLQQGKAEKLNLPQM